MELIYLYIEKFNNDTIRNQEFNFSPNFDVKIENKKLIIRNKKSDMKGLYPENIKNITALIGKNGVGKTSVLDIIGMDRDDRIEQSRIVSGRERRLIPKAEDGDKIIDSYFLLYHISGNDFAVEIMDDIKEEGYCNLFESKLNNFKLNKNIIKEINPKIPISLIIKRKRNNDFEIISNTTINGFVYLEEEFKKKININYISNSYGNRIREKRQKDINGYEKEPYLFKRKYYFNSSKELQYKYISYLQKNGQLEFNCNYPTIEINYKFDYYLPFNRGNDEHKKWIRQLEEKLYLKTKINTGSSNENKEEGGKEKSNHKERFILDVLSRYIINIFIKGICGSIDRNAKEISSYDEKVLKNYLDYLKKVEKIEDIQENSEKILEYLNDERKEFDSLIEAIDYYKKDVEIDEYDKLIYITRYLYLRMAYSISWESYITYQSAIEEFFDSLKSLDKSYFNKKNISIECKSHLDKQLISLFKIYDKYFYSDNSDLSMRFEINFLNLSEGEYRFLDLLSKIFDIVTKADENELSILLLDEPDQSLHPEWSRKFIKVLCDNIKRYNDKDVQIILSTHSPFLISDLPKDNIILLKKEKSGECKRCDSTEFNQTFGANIHTLLTNSFFMDNTIGEFANQKIKEVIQDLNEKSREEILRIDGRKEEIEYIIHNIGEPVIKRKLENMYNKKFEHCKINKRLQELSDKVSRLENKIEEDKLEKVIEVVNEILGE